MKFTTKSIVLSMIIAVFTVGCSSTPNIVKEAEREEKAAAKKVDQTVKNLPKWFTNPPESTSQVVFVVGSGSSMSLSMSRHKAILDAQAHLADQINAMVSSMQKQYTRDAGVGQTVTIEDTELTVKKIVAEVEVAGYRVQEVAFKPNGRDIDSYVMLAYPIGATNTIRAMNEQSRMLRALPEQKKKAFDELQTEIEAHRD